MKSRGVILKRLGIAAAVFFSLWVVWFAYFRSVYPYGWTHVCDTQLAFALCDYAQAHDDAFPAGEATPEACLALLYQCGVSAHLLSGKSIDAEIAQEALTTTGTLGPDSCGWHYVPGLRLTDSPELALFWDKTGLGHNGGKLDAGGHIVYSIEGIRRYVPESEWQTFLATQKELRQNLKRD